jgi:hypothetical protein
VAALDGIREKYSQRALNLISYLEQNSWTSRISNATRYQSSNCVIDPRDDFIRYFAPQVV